MADFCNLSAIPLEERHYRYHGLPIPAPRRPTANGHQGRDDILIIASPPKPDVRPDAIDPFIHAGTGSTVVGAPGDIFLAHQTEFLIERMEEERGKAEAATLQMVRERHERAAASWEKLANRAIAADKLRAAEEIRKAEMRAEQARQTEQQAPMPAAV